MATRMMTYSWRAFRCWSFNESLGLGGCAPIPKPPTIAMVRAQPPVNQRDLHGPGYPVVGCTPCSLGSSSRNG